jgi:hypothetical protein
MPGLLLEHKAEVLFSHNRHGRFRESDIFRRIFEAVG